jgi:hypothetical protein
MHMYNTSLREAARVLMAAGASPNAADSDAARH